MGPAMAGCGSSGSEQLLRMAQLLGFDNGPEAGNLDPGPEEPAQIVDPVRVWCRLLGYSWGSRATPLIGHLFK